MKHTALFEQHKKSGAKIISFAGFEMPLEYTGIIDEHVNVRTRVGMFDVSHMGDIWVKGENAFNFLQRVTSNDIKRLMPGKVQYSCFPNGKGGIVDDLLVYQFDDQLYLLVVNAANIEKDWKWLVQQNRERAELENVSDSMSQLAIQGPLAMDTLNKLTSLNLSEVFFYTFRVGDLAGVDNVIISATGYTGAGGFEIYFPNSYAEKIWAAVLDAGIEFGLKPVGLAARDTLRLEMGYCLYGNDIDDTTSPIEAGLSWITRFTDDKDFIDREYLLKQKNEGTKRKLVGFEMLERGIPRQHYPIIDITGNRIGEVTSGTMSPIMNRGIGMGYVLSGYSQPGTEILIQIRNKQLKGRVVSFPIYKGEQQRGS